jgi:hypothetical protein
VRLFFFSGSTVCIGIFSLPLNHLCFLLQGQARVLLDCAALQPSRQTQAPAGPDRANVPAGLMPACGIATAGTPGGLLLSAHRLCACSGLQQTPLLCPGDWWRVAVASPAGSVGCWLYVLHHRFIALPSLRQVSNIALCLWEGTRRSGLGTDCTEPSACIGQHKPMHAGGSKRLCKLCSIAAVLLVASESGHLRASVTVGATAMWYDLGDEMGWCCVGLGPTACSLWGQCVGGAASTCNALPVESSDE